MDASLSDTSASVFKTFPEFSKLRLEDREAYEAFSGNYPPIADIQFYSLMTWWNQLDGPPIATLNGNLVLSYWLPGDETHAGLSLVGTNKVDESICMIFDYLRERGEPVKLVNVPEFVISHIRFPELFSPEEDRRQYEYILSVDKYYPLKNMVNHRRHRVERQLARMGEENMVVRSLDLRTAHNKKLLLDMAHKWWSRNINNFGKVEREAMAESVQHADELGIQNVCLFIKGELRGFCLYRRSQDKRYVIICHVKATHGALLKYDLMIYLFAKWFAEQGAMYANLNSDEGLLALRMFMLTLGPTNFFRKYTIRPAS